MSNETQTETLNVEGSLLEVEGNIFNVLAYFSNQARQQGIDEEKVKAVRDQVYSSKSYDEALCIIMDNMSDGGM